MVGGSVMEGAIGCVVVDFSMMTKAKFEIYPRKNEKKKLAVKWCIMRHIKTIS